MLRAALGRGERGSATAELAVGLPALVVVVAAGMWCVAVMGAQLECVDAARVGARAAARGEPDDAVRIMVGRAAPDDAVITISLDGDQARVSVSAAVRAGLDMPFPHVTVSARAVAAVEPGVIR